MAVSFSTYRNTTAPRVAGMVLVKAAQEDLRDTGFMQLMANHVGRCAKHRD